MESGNASPEFLPGRLQEGGCFAMLTGAVHDVSVLGARAGGVSGKNMP